MRRLLGALLLATFLIGCVPGAQVEIENRSDAAIAVTAVLGSGATERSRVEPGDSASFGPALTWHIHNGEAELELVHPGRDFAHSKLTAPELYRFAVVRGGCIRVIAPSDSPTQPDPYPLGGESCREEHP